MAETILLPTRGGTVRLSRRGWLLQYEESGKSSNRVTHPGTNRTRRRLILLTCATPSCYKHGRHNQREHSVHQCLISAAHLWPHIWRKILARLLPWSVILKHALLLLLLCTPTVNYIAGKDATCSTTMIDRMRRPIVNELAWSQLALARDFSRVRSKFH